jgi:hypothetical protein
MSDENATAETQPQTPAQTYEPEANIWMRGLFMLIFALFFAFAESLLALMAVVQFFWILFTKDRNVAIADFGKILGKWMRDVADFQTGSTDEKPFPWPKAK